MQSPLRWSEDADWKLDCCSAERLSSEEIRRLRAESERARETARSIRETLAQGGRHWRGRQALA